MTDKNTEKPKKFSSISIILALLILMLAGFIFLNFIDKDSSYQHVLSSVSFAKEDKAEKKDGTTAAAKKLTKPVTVFVTSWCYYCKITIDFLKENNIPFVVKDIEKNSNFRDEMVAKASVCRGGVPVLVVNEEIYCGFNPYILNELVKK